MSKFNLIMPKLGESIREARIIKWFVKEGDRIEEDEPVLEIATDKVGSEIPSPVEGVISKLLFEQDDLVPVGEIIAHINTGGSDAEHEQLDEPKSNIQNGDNETEAIKNNTKYKGSRFYSPLVKSIADKENISISELESIEGSGANNRINKADILAFIENRDNKENKTAQIKKEVQISDKQGFSKMSVSVGAEDEIIEMDRMRRLIAERMVSSKRISAHVTSMVEADVSNIVEWRNKHKEQFLERENEKLTYLPMFIEATAKALRDFPGVNASVDGHNIILRKNINIGIAVALDNGNLIVPVIKNADRLNIIGITKELNRLIRAARSNKLSPDDISGGSFSISNFGSFRNVMGTPIINQPEVAIMAIGTIEKKPAVVETAVGDIIAIRHKMFLSLTYDHRVVDGALGGAFLRKVADYMEAFDKTSFF